MFKLFKKISSSYKSVTNPTGEVGVPASSPSCRPHVPAVSIAVNIAPAVLPAGRLRLSDVGLSGPGKRVQAEAEIVNWRSVRTGVGVAAPALRSIPAPGPGLGSSPAGLAARRPAAPA